MKIRTGFVSNSSSASFIIKEECLSLIQETELLRYSRDEKNIDGWEITKNNDGTIRGFTIMDNGAMEDFFEEIGLDKELYVEWDGD